MNSFTDRSQESKNRSAETVVSQKRKDKQSTYGFEDNRSETIAQRKLQEMADVYNSNQQTYPKKVNNTGLPDQLKTGIEHLSGFEMNDVKVHYNSDKPKQLQAHAYAKGTDIHIASGQEKHIPHEAWHVVQQKQGRVKPTVQRKGKVNINDDTGLEKEADIMGQKAMNFKTENITDKLLQKKQSSSYEKSLGYSNHSNGVIQGVFVYTYPSGHIINTKNDDAYYEGIGFIKIIGPNGEEVWADRRNIEYVRESFGYSSNADDHEITEIHTFTITAPTHSKDWQVQTNYDDRIKCINEALDIIYKEYDTSELYILTAPEYFFAAQNKDSHFMSKKDYDDVCGQLKTIASSLPSNLVMVPGTIGYSEAISSDELELEIAKLESKHNELLNYVKTYKQVKKAEDNSAYFDDKEIEEVYNFDWDYEKKVESKDAAKKLFNRAFIFYNNTMESYDKMFESVSGERDRGNGDSDTLFEHGTSPFIREYKGVKIALQICSDLAFESLRGLEEEVDIQLVPASNYGGAENFQQAKALVIADSTGSDLVEMNEQKKKSSEPNKKVKLNGVKNAELSYFLIKK